MINTLLSGFTLKNNDYSKDKISGSLEKGMALGNIFSAKAATFLAYIKTYDASFKLITMVFFLIYPFIFTIFIIYNFFHALPITCENYYQLLDHR